MISIFIAPLIFFATVLGSFLPDLDSDSGRPIKVLLNILSIASTAYAVLLLRMYSDDFLIIILLSIVCYVFTYFIIGKIIKKLTHHRGMFHSIPAVFLCFFFSMYILDIINISDNYMILFSLSMGIGYLSHLILDETNSIVNLEGIPFIPKKSLGTAIKLYSKDFRISLVVYFIILLFFVKYYYVLLYFFKELKF